MSTPAAVPPGHPRFPALDGLRGLAALAVLLFHAGAASGFNAANPLGAITARGDLGVALFFLLSGFLLYRPFAAARFEGRPAPRPRSFYRRRLLRIVPAYWLALVVLEIWPGLTGDGWWRFALFAQNLSLDTVQQGIGPAWTLCVEMSFYLLLPVYAAAVSRAGLRAELLLLAAIFVASLLLRAWALHHASRGSLTLLFTLPAFGTWFSLGMGLALWSAAGRPIPGATAGWLAAAVVLFALLAWALGLPRTAFAGTSTLRTLAEHVGYGLVSLCVLVPAVRATAPQALSWTPAAWLGLVSYGLYLYHLPIIVHLAPGSMPQLALGGGGLALALAAVSYLALERPVLRLKERRRPSTG